MTTQVNHDPGDIAQEGDGDRRADEGKQGLDNTKADHIVPALGTITWENTTPESTHRGLPTTPLRHLAWQV